MVFAFWRRQPDAKIEALYGAIVAQARAPAFYADCGVDDTLAGRFEMLVLHLVLVIRRLRETGEAAPAQRLFDLFCRDMDHNLRELGVSDLGVPKRMRRFGEAFYGRAAAYDQALDAGDGCGLTAALARNVLAGHGNPEPGADRLADYVGRSVALLRRQQPADLVSGNIAFPAVLAAAAQPAAEDGR